jgi:hypothetical protein
MSWEKAVAKFERLADPFTSSAQRVAVIDIVSNLETKEVVQLTELLREPSARS